MKTVLSTLNPVQLPNHTKIQSRRAIINLLNGGDRQLEMNWKLLFTAVAFLMMEGNVLATARFVNGFVPDWNQPYFYIPGSPSGGPGPDPNNPGPVSPVDQWNDWCAPTSGANLAGHWADARGLLVADNAAFPNSTVAWAAGPSWQDYLADGTINRPPPQIVVSPLPVPATDVGWYMDSNRGVPYDPPAVGIMGGWFFNNPPHAGTFLKDIHAGLQNYLNSRYGLSGGVFWRTGTEGIGFAAGVNPQGLPAVIQPSEVSAFGEVMSEINTNRTLILSFRHWNIIVSPFTLAAVGMNTESALGGTYYTWGSTPGPNPTNAEDEVWNYYDNATALGHAVTVVGYIPAGDVDDRGPLLGSGPTDWVIVHDNWSTTPRNVIIPYGFRNPPPNGVWVSTWVANTTAVPWPTAAKFVKGPVPDWNQPYQYTVQSLNGGPGPDPNNPTPFSPVDQWNDWCAPSSAANLAGHWLDYHLAPVADNTAFSGSTMMWAAGPSWQDYLADGFLRPQPQPPPPPANPLPVPTTDIGWYLDCNLGVPYDPPIPGVMGGLFFNNPPHAGTFLKDIHAGLQTYLNSQFTVGGAGWDTGTEGKFFAAGMNSTGGVAQILGNPVSAFNAVKFVINRNHTLILSFQHWNVAASTASGLPTVNTNTEADWGGSYYTWSYTPSPGSPNAEDEQWNLSNTGTNLGHAVTAVGYIPAGDVLDPAPPTDWVIVHDNWASTPRNVIVPFDFVNNWVANTYAYPDPVMLQLTNIVLVSNTNAMVGFNGIPSCRHDLLWTTNLATTNAWSTAVSNVTFTPGAMWITNPVPTGDPQRFYRIKANY